MKILVVDDEKYIRESVRRILELEGFEADVAENGLSAQRKLMDGDYGLLISDLKMPGKDGLELIDDLYSSTKRTSVIIMSAYGDISDAVSAMKKGAWDYIRKPFNPDDLITKVRCCIDETCISDSQTVNSMIGNSPAMEAVKDRISRVAGSDATVLITGESGTGKEVAARMIHQSSALVDGPFVAINMGGVPEQLLESELFGHEKGAFTGADTKKEGLFQTASGGTLFLDEMGEIPGTLQVKLLRVLQDRMVRPLGSNNEIPMNARIIAATNKKLEDEVNRGTFREDLYYRLNVARIHLPPLRERCIDIPLLTGNFLKRLNNRTGQNILGIETDAMDALMKYPFPGNIRELENLLERGTIFSRGERLGLTDLDLPLTNESKRNRPLPEPESLRALERRAIEAALIRWEGNRTRAAKELGISRRTIINRISEYSLTNPENETSKVL